MCVCVCGGGRALGAGLVEGQAVVCIGWRDLYGIKN